MQRSYFTIGMFKLIAFVYITDFYQFIRSLGLSTIPPSILAVKLEMDLFKLLGF